MSVTDFVHQILLKQHEHQQPTEDTRAHGRWYVGSFPLGNTGFHPPATRQKMRKDFPCVLQECFGEQDSQNYQTFFVCVWDSNEKLEWTK